jgi:hypothetical protein
VANLGFVNLLLFRKFLYIFFNSVTDEMRLDDLTKGIRNFVILDILKQRVHIFLVFFVSQRNFGVWRHQAELKIFNSNSLFG